MAAISADDIFNCIFLNENDRIQIHYMNHSLVAKFTDPYMYHYTSIC